MMLKLPESYRTYCMDTAVRTAVDHILDSKSPPLPADIDWRDLPAFHRAVLSAHQVRCEYAMFLIELWDAVWKPTLEEFDLGTTPSPMTVTESQEWWEQKFDTNTVWELSWFYRAFEFTTAGWSFGAGACADVDSVMLAISYYNADEAQCTTQLELGDKWPKDDIEDNVAYTSKKLAPIQDGGIDLAPLREAADDALHAIREAHARGR